MYNCCGHSAKHALDSRGLLRMLPAWNALDQNSNMQNEHPMGILQMIDCRLFMTFYKKSSRVCSVPFWMCVLLSCQAFRGHTHLPIAMREAVNSAVSLI